MSRAENSQFRTDNRKPIPLFWWSETRLMQKKKENYGDLLSKYLVEKISGRPVKWVQPKKQPWYKLNKRSYLAAGSIIHHATKDSVIWGSGIIDRNQRIAPADFCAVRGPQTRKFLQNLGYDCPEVYGDPALLLPDFFHEEVKKKYPLGVVPHYQDYKAVSEAYEDEPEIRVIDLMTLDVEDVTREILECEKIISSSLHGLIVSHAFKIPAVWVEFSEKLFGDGVKFVDYLESVDLPLYKPQFLEGARRLEEFNALMDRFPFIPDERHLDNVRSELLTACPFYES